MPFHTDNQMGRPPNNPMYLRENLAKQLSNLTMYYMYLDPLRHKQLQTLTCGELKKVEDESAISSTLVGI